MIVSLILSLLLTELIEISAAFILGAGKSSELYAVFLINVITNPAAVYIVCLSRIFLSQMLVIYAAVEFIVLITEGLLYGKYLDLKSLKIHNSFVFSFILNGLSFAAGSLANHIQEVL